MTPILIYFFVNYYMKRIFIIILSIISFVFGTLISPSDGDELNYIHILFEWEQQPDAVEYNICLLYTSPSPLDLG